MGKSQKVEKSEFDLLQEDNTPRKTVETTEDDREDVYNLLGSLKLSYNTKKSKSGKTSIMISPQNKEQLNVLLSNINKLQNALEQNEYVVISIAQKTPYTLSLVITRSNAILKISYLSGFVKGTNMSIPISMSSINALQQILSALTTSEIGKKLLSVSNISSNTETNPNLL